MCNIYQWKAEKLIIDKNKSCKRALLYCPPIGGDWQAMASLDLREILHHFCFLLGPSHILLSNNMCESALIHPPTWPSFVFLLIVVPNNPSQSPTACSISQHPPATNLLVPVASGLCNCVIRIEWNLSIYWWWGLVTGSGLYCIIQSGHRRLSLGSGSVGWQDQN